MINVFLKLGEPIVKTVSEIILNKQEIKSRETTESSKVIGNASNKIIEEGFDYLKVTSNNKKEITMNQDNNNAEINKMIIDLPGMDADSKIKLKDSFVDSTLNNKRKNYLSNKTVVVVSVTSTVSVLSAVCLNGYKYKNRPFIKKIF